ncbi:MAG: cysteine synthase A [Muribaculaceae bacterium]|nr:cysteine synthase A [Muribaculaceae bacterium]
MARIYKSLTELIAHSPLLEVARIERTLGLKARVLVKIESFNPGGSVKDRAALSMIEDAEERGLLHPGALIVEPTSGNTGIGLAWIASTKGYRIILTMPDTMSRERMSMLKALGAELVLTPGAQGMKGAIAKAEEILVENPGSWMPRQFSNPANPAIHEKTTAQEIWEDTDGQVDILVAGVGTGGTLCGTSRGLKAHNPAIKAVGVEPSDSPVLEGGKPGPHKLQGIGAGFIPDNYDARVVDEVMAVTWPEARDAARMLAKEEGLLAGISSGAALSAALTLALKPENEGKTIVAILPDTGDRYLSTNLFDGE